MKIFKKEMRYDERTGKPKGEVYFIDHTCCDFTGAKINPGEAPSIYIDWHCIDPCFGAGGVEYNFGKKYKLNMHDFLSQVYCFANWNVYGMFISMLAQHKNKTFDQALRSIRIKTAKGMIERGQIKPWQLGAEDMEIEEEG